MPTPPNAFSAAVSRINAGRYREAHAILAPLAKRTGRDPKVLDALAVCELELGMWDSARSHLERIIRSSPSPVAYCRLAELAKRQGRLDEAFAAADRAAARDGAHPGPILAMADLLTISGRPEEAKQLIEAAIARGVQSPQLALALGTACVRLRLVDQAESVLGAAAEDPVTPAPIRSGMLHQLGTLYDSRGQYDRAFECFRKANDLIRTKFDPALLRTTTERIISTWTRDAVRRLPRPSRPSHRPIFLIGTPRCGSSLIEQIIDAHPQVHGGGEIPFLGQSLQGAGLSEIGPTRDPGNLAAVTRTQVDRAAGDYLRRIAWLDMTASRFADKNLFNFRHTGNIAMLFPPARVLHCRRDPLDTCLSIYFQPFSATLSFAFDLRTIGVFYREYERLMRHWQSVLPEPPLDVVYEDVVGDVQSQARRIIAHLGLEWDDACLRFYESRRITVTSSNDQVRRPVYASSVRRSEHYAQHLGPLREALGLPQR